MQYGCLARPAEKSEELRKQLALAEKARAEKE